MISTKMNEESLCVFETLGRRELGSCSADTFPSVLRRMRAYEPRAVDSAWKKAIVALLRELSNEARPLPPAREEAHKQLKEEYLARYQDLGPLVRMWNEESNVRLVDLAKEEAALLAGEIRTLRAYGDLGAYAQARDLIEGLITLFESLELAYETLVSEIGEWN